MTAIVILCSFAYSVISRTSSANSTNASFSTREQLGQLMMFKPLRPKSTKERTRPLAMSSRIERPASISSYFRSFETVNDTRIVSPIPLLISCSKAMRVLITPPGGMPASVTPKCNGTSGRCLANWVLTSMTFSGSESFNETQYRVKFIESR